MKCLNCNTINSENAQFCKNCGAELSYMAAPNTDTPDKSINLLLIVMATGLFISLFYFINNILNINLGYNFLNIVTTIISLTVTLVVAIIIPNKKAKIFLFISLFLQVLFFIGYKIF